MTQPEKKKMLDLLKSRTQEEKHRAALLLLMQLKQSDTIPKNWQIDFENLERKFDAIDQIILRLEAEVNK